VEKWRLAVHAAGYGASMGLAVFVGILVDAAESDPELLDDMRDDFGHANALLAEHGLPTFDEPETAPWEPLSFDMYGYSGLHYLRRIAAHLAAGRSLPPPGDDEASADPVQEAYYDAVAGKRRLFRKSPQFDRRFDHLLVHSDAEGFYVPVEFGDVLFGDDVPGTMLGSSHALARECEELAQALGVPADLDPESEELWNASEEQGEGDGWRRYGVESFTCVRLLAAARASVRRGAAVVYA
jgi:hypothetical protein